MEKQSNKKLYDEWLTKIKTSEKTYSEYYDLIDEIRKYYRNERFKNKQNIFCVNCCKWHHCILACSSDWHFNFCSF